MYVFEDKMTKAVSLVISVQGLHCLPLYFRLFDVLPHCKTKLFHFRTSIEIFYVWPRSPDKKG